MQIEREDTRVSHVDPRKQRGSNITSGRMKCEDLASMMRMLLRRNRATEYATLPLRQGYLRLLHAFTDSRMLERIRQYGSISVTQTRTQRSEHEASIDVSLYMSSTFRAVLQDVREVHCDPLTAV